MNKTQEEILEGSPGVKGDDFLKSCFMVKTIKLKLKDIMQLGSRSHSNKQGRS